MASDDAQPQTQQRLSVDQALAQGLAHHRGGKLTQAEHFYQAILKTLPEHADALHLLGALRHQQGRHEEGLTLVEQAMVVNPDQSFYHNTHGRLLLSLNRADEAVADFQKAVALDPQNAEAHFNLGEALAVSGRLGEALASYRRALNLRPIFPQAAAGVGRAMRALGDVGGALPYLQLAMAFAPDNAGFAEDVALTLYMLGHLDLAAERYEEVLKKHPDHLRAQINLAACYSLANKKARAITLYEEARAALPDNPTLLDGLYEVRRQACDWDGLEALEQKCLEVVRRRSMAGQATGFRGFTVLYLPLNADEIRLNNTLLSRQMPAQGPLWKPRQGRESDRRLRIGYLTADVKEHPTAHLIADMFEQHDRSRFEVFCYSWARDDRSLYRRKIQAEVEHFVECYRLPDKELAERVAADEIDVLVDLMGHTADNRIGLLAWRPAPVQITYLGYPGTTGADYVDYLIADKHVAPYGCESEFSEQLIRLPYTYQINSHRNVPLGQRVPRQALGLPETGTVFCCMNSSYKIDPFVFDIWMRLLQKEPDSVLWLLQGPPGADDKLRAEAKAREIDPARLVFAPRVPRQAHLTRLQTASLFLDTRFYNAHTTATDALWAGVPVLTVEGDRFSARVATGLVRSAGLPELVMPSWERYEQEALRLAQDKAALGDLRAKLRGLRADAAVFNTPATVRALEEAYETVWARWQADEPVQALDLSAG